MSPSLRRWFCALAGLLALGCSQSATMSPVTRDAGVMPAVTRCGADNQAPLRDSDGRPSCTQVGSVATPVAGDWPDPPDGGVLPPPVFHVRSDASPAGADGSRAHPFATLAAVVGTLPEAGGTVVIARGSYLVEAPLGVRGDVVVVGAGAAAEGGTELTTPASTIFSASGATARLTLRNVALRSTTPGNAAAPAAAITAQSGAGVRLENVGIEQSAIGVRLLTGARLSAERLTIRRALVTGLLATDRSRCDLRDIVIRDGAGRGIDARDSHVSLHRALIHENDGGGVLLSGSTTGDAMGGAALCTVGGPSTEAGPLDCLSDAAITCNGIAGLFVQATATGAMRVVGQRLVLSGTRLIPGTPGGDGLVVQGGAACQLDPDVATLGSGSEVVGNARMGILVQNGGSTLAMRGAMVGANAGAGLFIGNLAVVSSVTASEFAYNGGVGVAVASSTELMELRDSTIHDTRMGVLPGGTAMIGDGLSAGNATLGLVVNNELSGNPRFPGVFAATTGVVRENRGSDNGFQLYAYDSPGLVIDATNRVEGRAAGSGRPAVTTEVPR